MTNLALNLTATTVEADTPCTGCGYNLRSLQRDGTCPECGTNIAISLRGDALWFSSARWITSLQIGSVLLILNAIVQFSQWVFYTFAFRGAARSEDWQGLLLVIGLAILALDLVGILCLTALEPRDASHSGDGLSARASTRIVLCVYVAVSAGLLLLRQLEGAKWIADAGRIVQLVLLSLNILISISFMLVCRRLARRMRRGGLVAWSWINVMISFASQGIWIFILLMLLLNPDALWSSNFPFFYFGLGNWLLLGEIVSHLGFWIFFAFGLAKAKQWAALDAGLDANVPPARHPLSTTVSEPT